MFDFLKSKLVITKYDKTAPTRSCITLQYNKWKLTERDFLYQVIFKSLQVEQPG